MEVKTSKKTMSGEEARTRALAILESEGIERITVITLCAGPQNTIRRFLQKQNDNLAQGQTAGAVWQPVGDTGTVVEKRERLPAAWLKTEAVIHMTEEPADYECRDDPAHNERVDVVTFRDYDKLSHLITTTIIAF